ncbi:MAG TPA: glycosyltransferase, partial [Thermoanaerobaculia bacterium]|nr:glycosyltransferase [Thermoanaerobaculia bacterium]
MRAVLAPPGEIDGLVPDLDVIIVHYHAAPLVRQAVDALRRDAAGSGLAVRVLVADNGSTPEERALLRSLPVEYLATGRDAGYAGGVNFAFPATHADFIVVMNEDVVVLPGCLAALRDALQAGAAVAGPEFFWDLDRQFVLPCTEERTRRNELLKAAGKRDLVRLSRARRHWREHARRHWRCADSMPSTALSGALLAFRRDTWTTAGGLDERYQMYFDENDWLFRVAAAGLQSVYLPRA